MKLTLAALAFGASALAGCVSTGSDGGPLPEAANPSGWDTVAFESKSWGRPIRSWTISSSGQGSWTKASEMENGELARYDLEWREVDAGAEGAAKLSALLSQVPVPAPDSSKCTDFMTDSVYGTLRITRGATTTEIAWNSGCMDEEYRAFLAPLREADQLVAEWGETGTYLRTESYGETPDSGS